MQIGYKNKGFTMSHKIMNNQYCIDVWNCMLCFKAIDMLWGCRQKEIFADIISQYRVSVWCMVEPDTHRWPSSCLVGNWRAETKVKEAFVIKNHQVLGTEKELCMTSDEDGWRWLLWKRIGLSRSCGEAFDRLEAAGHAGMKQLIQFFITGIDWAL